MSLFFQISQALAFFICIQPTAATPHHVARADPLPFKTSYLFSAVVNLGPPNPIPIPGGVIVPEVINGGTVAGPCLNGTIVSGLAAPRVYLNQTLQEPVIDIYGITEDGVPLHIHETGIGSPEAQITRIDLDIGGGEKYAELRTGFIMATVNPNKKRTVVNVKAYLVENELGVQGV